MSRGVSAAAKTYAGPISWLIDIVSPEGTTYYYWDGKGSKTIGGHTYQPYLRITSSFRHTLSLNVDSGSIELDNTDLSIENLLLNTATFDGAVCLIQQYLFGIDESVQIMRGRLTNQERKLDSVAYRVVSEFEPAAQDGMPYVFAALCRWRFKGAPCGYTGNTYVTCTKDYAACVTRGQAHRFSGVPTVSPEMTRIYGPGGADLGSSGDSGDGKIGEQPLLSP